MNEKTKETYKDPIVKVYACWELRLSCRCGVTLLYLSRAFLCLEQELR